MDKVTWNKIFTAFKRLHPELHIRGITYQPYDYSTIKIWIPTKGVILYNFDNNEITWVEEWVDYRAIKMQEDKERPDMYKLFCVIVEDYMRDHQLTHQQFADMADISRTSLSQYLNGVQIPKVSTMRRICGTIGIDI